MSDAEQKLEDAVKEVTNDLLERSFTYHSPKGTQPERYLLLREKAKELAYLLRDLCPNSREKLEAAKKLEECVMWANKSIAVNE